MGFLYPLIYLAGLGVCRWFLDLSRHVRWIAIGFGTLALNWLMPYAILLPGFRGSALAHWFFSPRAIWMSLINPGSWACIVIGLALVCREMRRAVGRLARRRHKRPWQRSGRRQHGGRAAADEA